MYVFVCVCICVYVYTYKYHRVIIINNTYIYIYIYIYIYKGIPLYISTFLYPCIAYAMPYFVDIYQMYFDSRLSK